MCGDLCWLKQSGTDFHGLKLEKVTMREKRLSDSLGVNFFADIGAVCLRKTLGSSPGFPVLLHQSCNYVALIETESERNHI
jgi:hypothetical protein